jgi:hypothetical protein
LTLYSQLFAGTTRASHDDAVSFVKAQGELKEVHFLDVFAPKDVFAEILGEWVLCFLYSFEHAAFLIR